jgi:phosphate transport system substrate-binding protein
VIEVMRGLDMKIKYALCAIIIILAGDMLYSQDEPKTVDDDVSVFEYIPFNENSKIAVLDGEPLLRFNENPPRLDGATALYPVYSAFVNALYPRGDTNAGGPYWVYDSDNSIVMCNRTARAYENLINGRVDMIFCAEPSKDQIAKAAEKGLRFNMTPAGKDAFVFFVNENNPIGGLTSSQIRNIYSGNITNWEDAGGENGVIIPYQRPDGSGSQTILQSIMGDIPVMEPLKENVAGGMGGIIERVASYKNYENAAGYSFLFFTTEMVKNGEIKLLAIDDIYPSKETIQTGAYPFSGTFYAITLAGHEDENVKKFIAWMVSEQGQCLVEKTGYVPLK